MDGLRSRPVVVEIPLIGVGGGDAGASGEGSLFKYGFSDQAINFVDTTGLIAPRRGLRGQISPMAQQGAVVVWVWLCCSHGS